MADSLTFDEPWEQQDLRFPSAHRAGEIWEELSRRIVHTADRLDRKEVAWELDISRKYLDNLLAQREGRQPKAEQLIYFLVRDPALLEWLAGELGYQVQRRPRMTAREELAALKAAVRSLGPVGDTLLEMAKGSR